MEKMKHYKDKVTRCLIPSVWGFSDAGYFPIE